jgi:Werner syndrome ATP-dependent helicase
MYLAQLGITQLKDKQIEVIDNVMANRDVCCVLPTGYGKSLCYQLPALQKQKPVIIISPLLSLMEDQQDAMRKKGMSVCCYNSNIPVKDRKKIKDKICNGDYQLIYITPEFAIHSGTLLNELNESGDDDNNIGLFAIDEAHCVSTWGHSFRPEYRQLSCLKKWFPKVPVLALTGTATSRVEKDICTSLGLVNPVIIKSSFDRPNLFIKCVQKTNMQKDILPLLVDNNDPVIIYCITRADTEKIAEMLNSNSILAKSYHGAMNNKDRFDAHHSFINDTIRCIVATNSFGMGIDKANVRMIIHYGSPKDIESYYQEIGRGSRDGGPCMCITFFGRSDFATQKYFLNDIQNDTYKKYRYSMLACIENYMFLRSCRRVELLKYFDELYIPNNSVSCCDNCANRINGTTTTEEIGREVLILLNTVQEFNDKFGINTIINIIKGSKAKTVPQYCYNSPNYGSSNKSLPWWKSITQHLIGVGYIAERKLHSSFGFVVYITMAGIDYIMSGKTTYLLLSNNA